MECDLAVRFLLARFREFKTTPFMLDITKP
jgi:hypothetical protein